MRAKIKKLETTNNLAMLQGLNKESLADKMKSMFTKQHKSATKKPAHATKIGDMHSNDSNNMMNKLRESLAVKTGASN